MAATYTYDVDNIATDVVASMRATLGDTDVADGGVRAVWNDQELAFYHAQHGGDLLIAAAMACRAAAVSASKIATAIDVLGGAASVDRKSVSDRYLRLADAFERRSEADVFSVMTQYVDGDVDYIDDALTSRNQFEFEDATE